MATDKSARRLGRGLDALLGDSPPSTPPIPDSAFRKIRVSHIKPNPYQPRKEFKSGELDDLQQSLETSGLLQPITVRPTDRKDQYELISGERRLRAATRLGWKEIPAIVKNADDRELLSLALVENLQRSDLNPVEEADGYARLLNEFKLSHQEIAERVGKNRSTIANSLRVLNLPDDVIAMLRAGKLTLGHAKPLLSVNGSAEISRLAREIVEEGMTVREVEQRTKKQGKNSGRSKTREDGKPTLSDRAALGSVERRLRRFFQTDISVQVEKDGRGALVLRFYSPDDLNRMLELMKVPDE